jgi:hypothetical protein
LASLVDNLAQVIDGLFEDANTCRRDPIGTTTGVGIEGLDEPSLLEARYCLVQGPGSEANAREASHVLHESVAVFFTGSQAGEKEEGHAADDGLVCLGYLPRRSHKPMVLRSA